MNSKTTSLILVLFGLIGCDSNESYPLSENRIEFTVSGVAGMQTRAGYDRPSDITASDPGFGIYVTAGNDTLRPTGNRADNHQMKWDGTSWFDNTVIAGGAPMLWPTDFSPVNAYAYCPFIQDITDPHNMELSVRKDQSTAEGIKASDLIRAESRGKTNTGDNTIPLTFFHQLAKLQFNIIRDEPEKTGKITGATVHDVGFKYTYDLCTGKVIKYPAIDALEAYCYSISQNNTIVEAIIVPGTKFYGGLLLSVRTELNGSEEIYAFSYGKVLDIRQNTVYSFNIRLTNSQQNMVTLSPVEIGDWSETDTGSSVLNPIKLKND